MITRGFQDPESGNIGSTQAHPAGSGWKSPFVVLTLAGKFVTNMDSCSITLTEDGARRLADALHASAKDAADMRRKR